MPFDAYKKALIISKEEGCMGFAVGRAVWQELDEFSTKEERETFIKSTAVNRMKELSELF